MKRILFLAFLTIPMLLTAQRDWSKVGITTDEVKPGIYRLFVADAVAVVVQVGADGVLVIDAAYEQTAEKLLAEIKSLSSEPIRFLINTHLHSDHTGGNSVVGKDAHIIAHPSVKAFLGTPRQVGDKTIVAFPAHALPDITLTDRMTLDFNSETIEIIHLPGGHTAGDLIIHFPKAGVAALGDLLFANYFPFVDVANGGNPIIFLENVKWIIDNFSHDIKFIGGHGPVFTRGDLMEYHRMLSHTLEIVKEAKTSGMSLEKMKENRILKSYESFGKFFITEDRWLDTLYPFL